MLIRCRRTLVNMHAYDIYVCPSVQYSLYCVYDVHEGVCVCVCECMFPNLRSVLALHIVVCSSNLWLRCFFFGAAKKSNKPLNKQKLNIKIKIMNWFFRRSSLSVREYYSADILIILFIYIDIIQFLPFSPSDWPLCHYKKQQERAQR